MVQENEQLIIRQGYFEIHRDNFINQGNSRIVFSRGSARFCNGAVACLSTISSMVLGGAVGALGGATLGAGLTEVFTGKGFSQPLTPHDPGFALAGMLFMTGMVGGMISGGFFINKRLQSQGLRGIPTFKILITVFGRARSY